MISFKTVSETNTYELRFSTEGLVGRANEKVITARLREVDPDERDWGINTTGPGRWYSFAEYVAVIDTPAGELLRELVRRMEDYPVLDENVLAEAKLDEAELYWKYTPLAERVKLCQKAGISSLKARHRWVPTEVIEHMHLMF